MAEIKTTAEVTVIEAGRLGGLARAKKLTKKQRSESARKAVNARWAKERAKNDKIPRRAKSPIK